MAVTQDQLTKLEAALSSRVLEVRDGEHVTKFESIEAIEARIAAVRSLLASQANPTRSSPRYQLADFRDD